MIWIIALAAGIYLLSQKKSVLQYGGAAPEVMNSPTTGPVPPYIIQKNANGLYYAIGTMGNTKGLFFAGPYTSAAITSEQVAQGYHELLTSIAVFS